MEGDNNQQPAGSSRSGFYGNEGARNPNRSIFPSSSSILGSLKNILGFGSREPSGLANIINSVTGNSWGLANVAASPSELRTPVGPSDASWETLELNSPGELTDDARERGVESTGVSGASSGGTVGSTSNGVDSEGRGGASVQGHPPSSAGTTRPGDVEKVSDPKEQKASSSWVRRSAAVMETLELNSPGELTDDARERGVESTGVSGASSGGTVGSTSNGVDSEGRGGASVQGHPPSSAGTTRPGDVEKVSDPEEQKASSSWVRRSAAAMPKSGSPGFHNPENLCYVNSCLQGLLSIDGFVEELQRNCWTEAIRHSRADEGDGEGSRGHKSAPAISATANDTRALDVVEGSRGEGGQGGARGDVGILAELLQLAREARASRALMDASPLKEAVSRQSGRFTGTSVEDGQEFLNCLLNNLHEEFERSSRGSSLARCHGAAKEVIDTTFDDDDEHSSSRRSRDRSRSRSRERGTSEQDEQIRLKQILPTAKFFQAEVETVLTCTKCGYSRRKTEMHRDFSLDVHHDRKGPQEEREDNGLGVDSLLDKFFEPTARYFRCVCDNDWVMATPSLSKLPGTLILHLKRFESSTTSPVKLDTSVAISTELDLGRFCTGQTANAPANDIRESVDSIERSVPKSFGGIGKRKLDEDVDLGEAKRARGSHGTSFRAGVKDKENPISADAKGTTDAGIIEDGWKCSVCTLLNKRESLTCEACGSRLPREGPLRARYKLRSVIHHLGETAGEGHYVTDVREVAQCGAEMGPGSRGEASEEGWTCYDDDDVYPVSEATALEGQARRSCYICFYTLEGR